MSTAPSNRFRYALALGVAGSALAFLSHASQSGENFISAQAKKLFASPPIVAEAQVVPDSDRSGDASSARTSARLAAARQARHQAVRKSPATERQIFGGHQQQDRMDPSRRMPQQSPLSQWVDTGYDHSSTRHNVLKRPSIDRQAARNSAMAAATCNTAQFGNLSGSALVAAVKAADTSCVNELFGVSGTAAYNTFREAQMVTIANALTTSATYYDGTNADSTLQLVLFLRAGYYVQYYDSSVGSYGAALKNAIRPALDAFAGNGSFGLVNDTHGETLAEVVTLIDSSAENARYLYVVKRLLANYNSSYNSYFWMKTAVNNAYTVTFRGHQNADFQALVQSDHSIVDSLYNFANTHFGMLGEEDDYLVSNAGRELGRFLQYSGSLKSLAQSRAKALLDRSSVSGVTARLWVGVGEMVDYYDQANCGYYDLCDFVAQVQAAALPISHTCSPTLRIRAQAMSSSELASTCSIVAGQETYFHQAVASNNTPVANDNNAALEMVVFDSSSDYGTYAGAIYGINTNNGGMYLEGNPAAAGNQARFIAYEAEWLQPESFEIWNLTHEYVHYLDGRFNMHGDFTASISQNTIWWIEGFAEYMSYSYRQVAYTAAQNEAAAGTYDLSEVYQNDYNSGQTLIYNWGYLAARFMFEERRGDVSTILGYLRPGNYMGYASFMNSIATSNDAAFSAWLPCVADPEGAGCGGTPSNQPPVAGFGFTTNGLTASFTNTSSDPDGSIASRSWNFGDGTTSTAANPSKAYAVAGTYQVRLTVTDDDGASSAISKAVTVVASNQPPAAAFTSVVNGLLATFTDGSSDPDGSIVSRSWNFGDGTSSTATNPSKTYAAAGTYTVQLTVTDNLGATHATSRTITVSGGGSYPECSGLYANELGRNCTRSNQSATGGNYVYMYVYVPAGTRQLQITVSGGSGNANLYVNTLGNWATRNSHNYRSVNAGNNESVTVDYPPSGYVYVSLHAASDFSGAQILTRY
ncbi:microbial collagenase [Luteimonas cucumeris]|uniref:microbial collagenase n=1 Tax=Luteimonas cucumeris TaxID=985012 RepID=A0A562LBR6_9GAMM|nr:collagenase [Luteimonas cucumeris]TWI04985.1 microbial collagenase [Luteimonas cucumeris]